MFKLCLLRNFRTEFALPSLLAGLVGLNNPPPVPLTGLCTLPTPFVLTLNPFAAGVAVPLACEPSALVSVPSAFGGWEERGFVFWRARPGRGVGVVEGGGGVGSRAGGGMEVPSVREEVGRVRAGRVKVLRLGSRVAIVWTVGWLYER